MCTIVGREHAWARSSATEDVVACLRSILASAYSPLEVILVDQSPTDIVADAVRPLREIDARFRYLHSDVPGLARSQNVAIQSSDADLFVFTDDDCLVPPDWVENIVGVFNRHPEAGLAFGEVRPPPGHDWRVSFVPELHVEREAALPNTFLPRVHSLLGANMAVQRRTFERIGLMEDGLGTRPINAEPELTLRALRAGISTYLSPAFHVVHEHGSRPQGEPARRVLRSYHQGKSAILVKHALRGDLGAACKLMLLAFEPFVTAAQSVLATGRPRGLGMIKPYFVGLRDGLSLVRRD